MTITIHPKKQKINTELSCEKAPIKIIHYPTSYVCNNNIHDINLCNKRIEKLYPYGKYNCKSVVCNICVNVGQSLEKT